MNVKDLIAKKQSKKENKHLSLKDINHDLIVSIFAVSVYGKAARDEDILEIIIGGPTNTFEGVMRKMREDYDSRVKEAGKNLTRNKKTGVVTDQDGFILLQPR